MVLKSQSPGLLLSQAQFNMVWERSPGRSAIPTQQAEITAGVEEWAKVSGVQLQQVEDPSKANIKIGYGDPTNLIGQDIWYYNPSNSFIDDLVLLKDPAIASLSMDGSGQPFLRQWRRTQTIGDT